MNIDKIAAQTPLYRSPLSPGTNQASYEQDLIDRLEDMSARPMTRDQVKPLESLQSEGYQKRQIGDAEQAGMSLPEVKQLLQLFQNDLSALPRLQRSDLVPDQEVSDVLRAAAQQVGGHSDLFFYPGSSCASVTTGYAVRVDPSLALVEAYDLAFHETPGLDGGLFLSKPYQGRELRQLGDALEYHIACRPGLSMATPEEGWQLHPFSPNRAQSAPSK